MTFQQSNTDTTHPASFRDPSGFIYRGRDGQLLRQVNRSYSDNYDLLMKSGLYDQLVKNKQLIPHQERPEQVDGNSGAYKILQPELITSISYPAEWAFSALKASAILTLDIQEAALEHGMSLKDASAYNVQFQGTAPVFIDTLSFESYQEGDPWVAYGQFCRHFLAPLALMQYRGLAMSKLFISCLDGVPLDMACRLLPRRTWASPGLLMHLHLNNRMTQTYSDTSESAKSKSKRPLSKDGLRHIIESLRSSILRTKIRKEATTWGDYYQNNTYDSAGQLDKSKLVASYLERIQPKTVWDLGANTGRYSRIAADLGADVVAYDIDPICVERNYHACIDDGTDKILPLTLDLANPTPAIGWANEERDSLQDRADVDVVMALALVHHLAIANNIPLRAIAKYFSKLGENLLIEWVPKDDPQVQRLLSAREDIFDGYHQDAFEREFSQYFDLMEKSPSGTGGRMLYRMKAVEANHVRLAG